MKNSEVSEKMKSTSTDSTDEKQMSNDFRETLLKSGLDPSMLQLEESGAGNSFDNKSNHSASEDSENVQVSPKAAAKENRTSPKRWKYGHLIAIAGIAAVIILQFVFQFSLLQDESLRAAENLIRQKSSEEQIIERKGESITSQTDEPTKIEAEAKQKEAASKVVVEQKKNVLKNQRASNVISGKSVIRKKEPRESTAERLRRAERILTGV